MALRIVWRARRSAGRPLKLDERAWDNYIQSRRYREGQEYLQLTSRLKEIAGIADTLKKVGSGKVEVTVKAGSKSFNALLRIDTPQEVLYYQHGGILNYVLRQLR